MQHVGGCPARGRGHTDGAKRISDACNMHWIAQGWDSTKYWCAFKLEDGRTPDIDVTLVSSAAAQKLGTFKISPNGWLAGGWCLFEGTGFTTATYTGDNPVSGIQKMTFRDVGNREIIGPLTGYEWASVQKFGGYYPGQPDWRNPATGYAATATGFAFVLWFPLELVYRDSLGEIENKS